MSPKHNTDATDAADDLNDGLDYEVDFSEEKVNDSPQQSVQESPQTLEEPLEKPPSKKRKSDSKLKEKKKAKMDLDIQRKKSISTEVSPEIIADYINQTVAQKNKKLSGLELSELYLSKTDLRGTNQFTEPRTLSSLSSFITKNFGNMLKTPDDERKFVAMISMSAIRACDVHRATRNLNGSSLKLINKNKIAVDLKLLPTTKSRLLCCTPGRLGKILNHPESPLKPNEIKIIILDHSYLDLKSQNIWDIDDTIHTLKLLTASGSKIYLY